MAEAMTGLELGDDEGVDTHHDLFACTQQGCRQRRRLRRRGQGGRTQPQVGAAAGRRVPPSRDAPPRRNKPRYPCATSSASSPVPCTPTAKPMRNMHIAKTAMMLKPSQAHAANDLLTLLELHLQIDQIESCNCATCTCWPTWPEPSAGSSSCGSCCANACVGLTLSFEGADRRFAPSVRDDFPPHDPRRRRGRRHAHVIDLVLPVGRAHEDLD